MKVLIPIGLALALGTKFHDDSYMILDIQFLQVHIYIDFKYLKSIIYISSVF